MTPELGYGYDHLFATDDAGSAYAWDMQRLFAGARVGFGHLVVPTVSTPTSRSDESRR